MFSGKRQIIPCKLGTKVPTITYVKNCITSSDQHDVKTKKKD